LFCSLSEIICSSKLFTRELTHPERTQHKSLGTITIHSEEIKDLHQDACITFAAEHLDKKDLFGKSDHYLEIFKFGIEDNKFYPIHKTEIVKHNLDPVWQQFTMPVANFCGGDFERPIKIQCWDHKSAHADALIGECTTTLSALAKTVEKRVEFELIDPEQKQHKKHYVNSGILVVTKCSFIQHYTFLDYLYGGHELSVIVAIDFTGSNGDPHEPTSLHYNNPPNLNEYEHAITAVGTIIEPYDAGRMFAVYGFGAKINDAVTHCFPLNGNSTNPEVQGVQGILSLYQYALDKIELYGPTIFQQVIDVAAQIAQRSESMNQQKYYVLLLITDGAISDEQKTIREIVRTSNLPLSILVVGVGNEEFAEMRILEGGGHLLKDDSGNVAVRHNVEFVPMRDYRDQHHSEMAKDVLDEIPREFLEYMKSKNIIPSPRRVSAPPM